MGDYLRNARRQRRVSIDRAAEQTRIRADYLMRMESDEFDFLAPAYVRGFLRTYARFLRVSEEPLIEEFDRRYGRARAESSQIAALERRTKSAPRNRPAMSSWAVAASLAAVFLVILGVIGLMSGPDEEPADDRVASFDDRSSPEPTQQQSQEPTPTPTPTVTGSPSPMPTATDDGVIAFDQGIQVRITAPRRRCWIEIEADGVNKTPGGITLEVGDSAGTFRAQDSMQIVLGDAGGVDLIVNGRNLGPPGDTGPMVIHIPEDIQDLL